MPDNDDSEVEDSPREVFSGRIRSAAVTHATQVTGAGSLGVWTATIFAPPLNLTLSGPDGIFAPRRIDSPTGIPTGTTVRFALRCRHIPALGSFKTMAIFVDGACAYNGASANAVGRTPRAGCAFIFKPGQEGTISTALERKGRDGEVHTHTSNRAELRAAIAALKFRAWHGEGWERVVLITDSEYVGLHASTRLRKWVERGWLTSGGQPVKNRDLWEALSDCIGDFARAGCEVSFWIVPRRWNTLADAAAKAAIAQRMPEEFCNIFGACT